MLKTAFDLNDVIVSIMEIIDNGLAFFHPLTLSLRLRYCSILRKLCTLR